MENIWRDSSTIFSQKDYLLPLPEGNVLKTQFSSFKALTKLNWISSSYINNVPLELEKCFIYEHVFPFDLYGNLLCFVLIKIEWIKYIYTKKISSSLSLLLLLLLLSLQFLVHFSSIWLPMQKKKRKEEKRNPTQSKLNGCTGSSIHLLLWKINLIHCDFLCDWQKYFAQKASANVYLKVILFSLPCESASNFHYLHCWRVSSTYQGCPGATGGEEQTLKVLSLLLLCPPPPPTTFIVCL